MNVAVDVKAHVAVQVQVPEYNQPVRVIIVRCTVKLNVLSRNFNLDILVVPYLHK